MHRIIKMTAVVLAFASMAHPAYAGDRGHDRHWKNHGHRHYQHNSAPRFYFGSFYAPRPLVVERTYIVNNQYYQPTPVTYATNPQGYCREYYGPVRIGGRIQQAYGNACLMPDGSWQMVD